MVKGTREELLKRIGDGIRTCRLRENISQKTLAERSGVSLNAIRHLEGGDGAALATFVQACRILGKDRWILDMETQDDMSPIEYAEMLGRIRHKKPRVRASPAVRRMP